MGSSNDSSEGPVILELQKWGQLLQLSEFCEAFISPTREQLLLLSYEYEALLLPLIVGKKGCRLMSKDYLEKSNSENNQGYSSGPFGSTEATACTLDSFDDAPCTSESAEAAPSSEFQHHRGSSDFEYYPVIPDVRSVAWGHCGDGYDQLEDYDFREFLIVPGNYDIIVHAFRSRDKIPNNRSIASEDGHVHGEWVKWEPSRSTQLKEQLLHRDNSEIDFPLNNSRAMEETVHDNSNSSDSVNKQKNWFKTFLTELDTHVYDGSYISMFPKNSTFPHSADVVSFSIYNSTLLFLEFLSRTNISEQDNNVGTSEELRADFLSRKSDRSYPYKCSQVFSGSSHRLIGLVLTSSNEYSARNNENHLDNPSNMLVVIVMLHQWGLQWLCSVDLHDSCLAPGPIRPWADFQFIENFLVCLNTCGLICIWEAKTGKLIARFDALDSLEIFTKMPSSDGKTNKPNKLHINRTDTRELISHRFFKKLMVLPSSLLLGVVDDYGVVYIFHAGDYIPGNHILTEEYKHALKHCDFSILNHWNIAGCDIGSQHPLFDFFGHQVLQNSNAPFDGFPFNGAAFRKRTEQSFRDKGGLPDTYVSGFSSSSCTSGQKIRLQHSTKMRKVFLPLEKPKNRDFICLSSFGILRLTKSCSKKSQNAYKILCTEMHVGTIVDERNLSASRHSSMKEHVILEESLGFSFQGCFFLVTARGLSVILPSISVTVTDLPAKPLRCMLPDAFTHSECENLLLSKKIREQWKPWQVETLDRIILYDGFKEAEHVCLENGWDLRFACFRQMHLSLRYFMSIEIEKSLDMLADVHLAEEGVLQLLFVSAHLLCQGVGKGNEVALACRLLALASRFATKMIRKYGALNHKGNFIVNDRKIFRTFHSKPSLHMQNVAKLGYSEKLFEMAYYLEVIRDLLSRLASKNRRPVQVLTDGRDAAALVEKDTVQSETSLNIIAETSLDQVNSIGTLSKNERAFDIHEGEFDDASALSIEKVNSGDSVKFHGLFVHEAGASHSSLTPLENPKDMILRWEIDKFDPKDIVKDALHVGRLPLAVLQLHLHRESNLVDGDETHDAFSEVQDIGKAIAYDLLLKGECGLAVATLQRLGEDIELLLRQLLHGTLRRSLRRQLTEEMRQNAYLKPSESEVLEKIFLIERLYPSSSFWKSYFGMQKLIREEASTMTSPKPDSFTLSFHVRSDLTIDCGDVDGVVIGSWPKTSNEHVLLAADEDNAQCGYWASAVSWSDAWEQSTWDRIVLDQPSHMRVFVSWESQLEYYISHNDLEGIFKLLDVIPVSLMSSGSLKISLYTSTGSGSDSEKTPDHNIYICASEEMELALLYIPQVKIFRSSSMNMCSSWLKSLIEEELAKKYVFTKESWHGSAEIMQLITSAGLFMIASKMSFGDKSSRDYIGSDILNDDNQYHKDTAEMLHKLVVYHCAEYGLPYLLDLYLDHHYLPVDYGSLSSLLQAAGDYHWVKWLLSSRTKGCEYDASFYNLRSNLSQQDTYTNNLGVLELEEIIHSVDDLAEGRGELAALATLMYATSPLQKCIRTGSVNKQISPSSFSFQCTLENLRPTIHHFPTIWRTLVASCSGQDANDFPFSCSQNNGKSAFDNYLNWRNSIFLSAGGDTSLEQMLPCTFPKSIRRLTKIFVQGPIGWQSLSSRVSAEEPYNFTNISRNWNNGNSAISWETSIERSIEKELYSSLEDKGSGVEQNLHRGRALAAFNQILGARALSLKSSNAHQQIPGQFNIQSDVQAMLAPLSQSERSTVSSVAPLAIMHFEDPVMVASCMLLLELCGLSSSMLHVDISSLKRISSYHRSIGAVEHYDQVSPKGSTSAIHTSSYEIDSVISLAQALADDYVHNDHLIPKNRDDPSKNVKGGPQSPSLMTVLHHLEKACLPSLVERDTCGSWLQTGIGNGSEFRSKQKNASQQWSLVTKFCQMHHLPLSTQYLALLAQDNDWVGFLTEAQVGGFLVDVIVQVAAEFSDPRLRAHIVNVLKSTQSARRKTNSLTTAPNVDQSTIVPPELFEIIAKCERQNKPGEALLMKAKDLHWCLLAMVASCFSDVSPLSCLTVWLEITAARETSTIMEDDFSSKIAKAVGAAVETTNTLPSGCRKLAFHYNRRNPKRRCLIGPTSAEGDTLDTLNTISSSIGDSSQWTSNEVETRTMPIGRLEDSSDSDYGLASLSNMVAVLCEKNLFLPLLRAFEMFMPSCSLLPFIRSLQAFSQMRLSEASAHLTMFSARIKEESYMTHKDGLVKTEWVSSTAVKAANTMLTRCPSAYEKRCLLQLLAATDFADGGSASSFFRRLYWKINLAEPSLRKDDDVYLGNETLDDESLLTALLKNGRWEQARNWARQLESSGPSWKSAPHQVTEAQAEAMVAEWMDFLWDVPEERAALWNHCQTLFVRYSFPPLQAGLFFLKHAEAIEKDIPAGELHDILLLSLQWLSGTITQSPHVYPLHLLREIETRVWLLAVESEAQSKAEGDPASLSSIQNLANGNSASVIDQTATVISKMDNHINSMRTKSVDRNNMRDHNQPHNRQLVATESSLTPAGSSAKMKRRVKSSWPSRRSVMDNLETTNESDDSPNYPQHFRSINEGSNSTPLQEGMKIETSLSGWEERVRPAEMEKAVLALLEFGQIAAAKQLQQKISPENVPEELLIIDSALKIAVLSSSNNNRELSESVLGQEVLSVLQLANVPIRGRMIEPLQTLESLAAMCNEGCGRGLCWRIIAVVKAAKVLGLSFAEAFEKKSIELLQLLSLKAQDSFDEAKLLVQTHTMPPPNIAQVLAESFLKGLLAAHRGGYMDSQKEEGPAPLLWRFADFLKWAELCPSEPEIGHALMRLVMTGHEIPHACEVELLILSHHFYKSSACLDGVDVLVTLAANRVESYVLEGDFSCLARLITGVSNFYALNFILNILIENGQLELLLQKYSTTDMSTGTAAEVRGFRMAVLTSLKLFNPHDIDAFAMVYNHFDMKHETASLLESRSLHHMQQWLSRREKDRLTEDLLEAMRLFIDAAEVLCTIDAGRKTHDACAKASLLSLQIRIPDIQWIDLPEGKARNLLVEQSRFQEALILAEAYNLNQPSEWTPVLWNQTLKPDLIEQFIAEFVAVLPLHHTTLMELARFYRAEVAARGDQSHFSVWLTPGGLPAEWIKHLGRSFRSMLKRTRDLRIRMQLATVATGFPDVVNVCNKMMDKVPETAGPLVLRRGHGGAYLPLM